MARVLILGGTAEAVALAKALKSARRFDGILSLAGRTSTPVANQICSRIGGFGGAAGLGKYLAAEQIEAVIDATHPFATRISINAADACSSAGIPRIALLRHPWVSGPGDNWQHVKDEHHAARALPKNCRAFLAIGRQHIGAFAGRSDAWFLIRVVDPPEKSLLPGPHSTIAMRGPFAAESEIALLNEHAITHLVARNSGGTGASAKIPAARQLGLPVIMIDRPAPPPQPIVEDVAAALDWLTNLIG
ncbi:MAG: cobalt-precorrin-6A reductase [Rhizobiales bacterium]|nr:cobalt-precorrin-6A reductase [Hyphomicrobiales bacterium]